MLSMTGYGKGQASGDGYEVTAELKTVNHRFLDVACRLPRTLTFLEDTIRSTLRQRLSRGHVDVFLTVRREGLSDVAVRVDENLAAAYLNAASALAGLPIPEKLSFSAQLRLPDLMALEGVLTVEDADYDEALVRRLAEQALSAGCDQLTQMRAAEGERLRADLSLHLDAVARIRGDILLRAPQVPEEYRKRLAERIDSLLSEAADPVRIAQEAAIFADRCAIDEELSRLESHISQYRAFLDSDGEIGKKLDFLTQELNREANTIGSKANDAQISRCVVEMKAEIEKLREQAQNVE